ncbi:MAG: NAD-dependent epimerase/dehydratase family protein, partial [Alicyclobacillus sp.]|nr:NAD-dependent epimerase/dehydratase family protein [Alicyclobacillus sp.]
MTVLVTGGGGYIGSHTVADLVARGESVVVVDNLSTGHRRAAQALGVPWYQVDIRDEEAVTNLIRRHDVEVVVHFAARSLVGESVANPLRYYEDNVAATGRLLQAMVRAGVVRMVFSSTAAVYGEPRRTPIEEDDPTEPTNPYGDSKRAIERMLAWCHQAYGLQSVSLRYFNAAGAHPELPIGEDHRPETHLIPVVLQAALGLCVLEGVGEELASYATPQLATIDGRRWCFVFARGGLLGLDPIQGTIDFHYPWRSRLRDSVNASTPVVVGNEVFISETYGPGSSLLRVRPGGYEVVWRDPPGRDKAMLLHWNTPIFHEGYLYGSSGRHASDAELCKLAAAVRSR